MKKAGRVLKYYSRIIAGCIPLFVAAGLFAALAPEGGPGAYLRQMSDLLTYLVIPVFVGYQSGSMCGGDIGGLAGALAASAVVVTESASSMMMAVLVGSLAGYVSRRGLRLLERFIPAGFEMLVHNLYLTVIGLLVGGLTCGVLVPVTDRLILSLNARLMSMIAGGVIPVISLVVEPLKIAFFNNWINHGVFLPLGLEQVKSGGRSILFLLETNPGPGLGILAACAVMRRESGRKMASGMIIHMLGGIHEVYFPYVLSDIRLLAAAVAGGLAGNYCFMITGSGLRGPASPGSIFTILMMAERPLWGSLMAGILVSAAVACLISCLLMAGREGERTMAGGDAAEPEAETVRPERPELSGEVASVKAIKIYFVCDVGMGSSAMAGAMFRRRLKAEGLAGIEVFHTAASRMPEDADGIVCQADFARTLSGSVMKGRCFVVERLTDMSCYQELLDWLKGGG